MDPRSVQCGKLFAFVVAVMAVSVSAQNETGPFAMPMNVTPSAPVALGPEAMMPNMTIGVPPVEEPPAALIPPMPMEANMTAGGEVVTPERPPLSVRLVNCTDVPPGFNHTCAQQVAFGKCTADFMVNYKYCAKSCGMEPCVFCDDVKPPGNYTCDQQKGYGKCSADWMMKGGYCKKTCGLPPCPSTMNTTSDTMP